MSPAEAEVRSSFQDAFDSVLTRPPMVNLFEKLALLRRINGNSSEEMLFPKKKVNEIK
jgi:hypothetical protein